MEQKPKSEVSWRAAEYEHTHHDSWWFLKIGIAGLIFLAFAIWQKNFFFGVFIVIASAVILTHNKREPNVIDFRVSEKGVRIANQLYEYNEFQHFSVRKRPGKLDEIVFKRKIMFNPFLHIPADSRTIWDAREIIKRKIQEVEHDSSLLDVLLDLIGF